MAIDWLGQGGMGVRLGRWLGAVNQVNTFRKATTDTRVTQVLSAYQTNEQIAVDSLIQARDSYRQVHTTWLQTFANDATTSTVEQVNRDSPLTSKTITVALAKLIASMKANSQAFSRPTTSLAVTPYASNYGSAVLAGSLTDTDGTPLDMVLPESLTATVTGDAGRGSTAYSEPVQVVGLPSVDGLSYDWPQGSSANKSLTIADGATTTLVTNGGFDTWPTATAAPTGWTIGVGTANTTVVRNASVIVRGAYSCQFVGTGAELTQIYQPITGLAPNTVYCLNVWMRRSAGAAAGVVRLRLADGTLTTIANDNATANSSSITVSSGLTTIYVAQTIFFQTPKVLPSVVNLVLELTTAVTNTESVYFDLGSLVAATQLYAGGPFVAAFSGATQSAINDYWTIAVTNAGGTTAFVPALDRIFNLRQNGLKFPTTVGLPVVPDNYIG